MKSRIILTGNTEASTELQKTPAILDDGGRFLSNSEGKKFDILSDKGWDEFKADLFKDDVTTVLERTGLSRSKAEDRELFYALMRWKPEVKWYQFFRSASQFPKSSLVISNRFDKKIL
jgi:hypothetical protein